MCEEGAIVYKAQHADPDDGAVTEELSKEMPSAPDTIEEVDHLIIGAGQAGLVLARLLRGARVALVDPDPGGYKIGESIVPEQFRHPELQALLPRIHALPSYMRKRGVVFVSDEAVASFPLLPKNQRESMHVARAELEQLLADAWGLPIRRERVVAVDAAARVVQTDARRYRVARQLLDCSGPAMVVASALGEVQTLAPVHATWTYFDVTGVDDAAFFAAHATAGRRFVHYDARRRQILPEEHLGGWAPSHTTILTRIRPGTWCWQIPLFGGRCLGFGVVSRSAAVAEAELFELAERHHAPCYRLQRRPSGGDSAYDRVHSRSGFARRARRAATEDWILVGDAFAFADPVYSVGTALAVNRAVDVAHQLNAPEGWTPAACAAWCRGAEALMARAQAAFEFWYAGDLLRDDAAAAEVHDGFLVGGAFEAGSLEHYGDWLEAASLRSGRHQDDTQRVDPARPSVRGEVVALLGAESLAGWALEDARVCTDGLHLSWVREDRPELIMLVLVDGAGVHEHYRRVGPLGLSYMSRWTGEYAFDGEVRALFEAAEGRIEREVEAWVALRQG